MTAGFHAVIWLLGEEGGEAGWRWCAEIQQQAGGGAAWDPTLCMSVAGQGPVLLGMGTGEDKYWALARLWCLLHCRRAGRLRPEQCPS